MGKDTSFRLDDRETRLRALRDALDAGERSGPPTPFDFDAFLDGKRAAISRSRGAPTA